MSRIARPCEGCCRMTTWGRYCRSCTPRYRAVLYFWLSVGCMGLALFVAVAPWLARIVR